MKSKLTLWALVLFLPITLMQNLNAAEKYYWFAGDQKNTISLLINEYHNALDSASQTQQKINKVKNEIKNLQSSDRQSNVELNWSPDPVAASYLVIIKKNDGAEILRKKFNESSALVNLPPGQYTMQVAGVSADDLEGELSDPVTLNVTEKNETEVKKKNNELKELEKNLQQDIEKSTRLLKGIVKNTTEITDSPALKKEPEQATIRYRFANTRFSDFKEYQAAADKKPSQKEQENEEKKNEEQNKLEAAKTAAQKSSSLPGRLQTGLLPVFSLRDSAIDRFNNGMGFAIETGISGVIFPWLTPFFEAGLISYSGNAAPARSLTHFRFAVGAFASYPILNKDLYAEMGLATGLMFISFINDTKSENYNTSYVAAIPRLRYFVWRSLSVSAGAAFTYQFDASQNLLFIEPRLGIHYTF